MKLRPFELALIIIFGFLMALSLILLRTYEPEPSESQVALNGSVYIWGTLPQGGIDSVLMSIAESEEGFKNVSYRYVRPEDFNDTFVNALADGNPPDLILGAHELLVKNRSRIEAMKYTDPAGFRSTYVDGAEIFAMSDGLYAVPVAVDPLMLYWNRDLFSFKNLAKPPSTWEEVVSEVVPALTTRDFERKITQSAIAMGEYSNITNAFGIISLLTIQGGSSLVTESVPNYQIRLDEASNGSKQQPFSSAVTYYTNFNNVANSLYSWNRSLPEDREQFLAEKLAMYFGYGSEARELESRNPNLNFDIAEVPQGAGVTVRRTYGKFYGLMVPRSAKNKIGAYLVRSTLSNQTNAKKITDYYNLAPIYRSGLMAGTNDVYGRAVYTSALTARGWLNPDFVKTNEIFGRMVNDVAINRDVVTKSVNDAIARLEQVY